MLARNPQLSEEDKLLHRVTRTVREISLRLGLGTMVEGERGLQDNGGGPPPVVGFKTLLILNSGGCIFQGEKKGGSWFLI